MSEGASRNFGHMIAFLIPGFVVVWQLSFWSSTLASWLGASKEESTTIGEFAYVAVASLAAGLIVSALRASFIDWFNHKTGVTRPQLDYSKLQANKEAYSIAIEGLYRYYQFYANMFVAIVIAYCSRLMATRSWPFQQPFVDLGVAGIEVVLFLAARDSLRRCYSRLTEILH